MKAVKTPWSLLSSVPYPCLKLGGVRDDHVFHQELHYHRSTATGTLRGINQAYKPMPTETNSVSLPKIHKPWLAACAIHDVLYVSAPPLSSN